MNAPAPLKKPSGLFSVVPKGGGDEKKIIASFGKLKKRVVIQTGAIVVLTIILVVLLPFAQPNDLYYAMRPDQKAMRLTPLDVPNMTNQAVLSWATTSIAEIMTVGFGDIDVKLPRQRYRFTKEGWTAYQEAFVAREIGETFKKSQLVLTTVPSNTPVITGQGVNIDQIYQWNVEMPIIMTYATNNNVMRKDRAIVSLEIVRVPAEQSSSGIGIKAWAAH